MSDNSFGRRQLLSLCLVAMLAPSLRIFPSEAAGLAGRAAWLSPLFALPFLLVYMHFLSRLLSCRREEESFQDMVLRALGPTAGRWLLALMCVWMLCCSGFSLRAGVDRLIVTTYPNASALGFTLIMGALALCAALGSPRRLARMGRMLRPLVLGILGLIFLFALFSIRWENLLPVSGADVLPALAGSVAAAEIVGCSGAAVLLVSGGMKKEPGELSALCIYAVEALAILSLLSVAIVGSFGPELSAQLSRPFFVLVKNMVFFRTVERIEALVVMLWIFPDFLQTGLLLWAGQYTLRLLARFSPDSREEGAMNFSKGRWLIWLCAPAVTLFALAVGRSAMSLELWSLKIIPYSNMFFSFFVFPAIYIIGRHRHCL